MIANMDTARDLISNSGYPQEVIRTALREVDAAEEEVRALRERISDLEEAEKARNFEAVHSRMG